MDLSNNLNETANSYIISEPGNYEFPLVYGCGFINGKENPKSYSGDNFLDYKGEIINTPEIKYKIKDVKIISWDSDPEIIKNILIKENFIKFSITKVPKGGANYVIAILDDQEKIIWSWHIWLCNFIKDIKIGDYTLLNIPLASKLEDEKINIWYYQWGRKDPLCYDNTNIVKRSTNTMEAIQNPNVLYYNAGGNWNWIDNSNYWGKEKSIYDPCPRGYHVPGKESILSLLSCYESYKKDSIKIKFNNDLLILPFSGIKYSDGIFYKDIRGVFWCNDEVEERQCGSALHLQKCNVIITSYMKTEAVGIIPQKYDG